VALWLADFRRRSSAATGLLSLETFFEEKMKWLIHSK
jgi:hypothetical protein